MSLPLRPVLPSQEIYEIMKHLYGEIQPPPVQKPTSSPWPCIQRFTAADFTGRGPTTVLQGTGHVRLRTWTPVSSPRWADSAEAKRQMQSAAPPHFSGLCSASPGVPRPATLNCPDPAKVTMQLLLAPGCPFLLVSGLCPVRSLSSSC